MENPAECAAKGSPPKVRRRRSIFSVLNDAADRNCYRNNEDYQKLVHAETSEWNKLMKESTTKCYSLPKRSLGLNSEGIREKVASFALDPEVFLAEQKKFVETVREFLEEHRQFQEKVALINEATACLMDEVTVRAMEEEKYKSH